MAKHRSSTPRNARRHVAARTTCGKVQPLESARTAVAGEPAYDEPPVERQEAIWLDGSVPSGYWDRPENRRRYMRWLGQRLGFRSYQDWYRITTNDFKRNRGGALLHHWDDSAIRAVEDTFREYDWKPWLFMMAPLRFWHDPDNHRRYMDWLGEQLGIREPSEWYRVTNQDFKDHGGGAFLIHYDCTVSAAIKSYLTEYDWKEWMFDSIPKGFWQDRKNRRRYMGWLGTQLGYQTLDDWYAVTGDDFLANHGKELLKRYGSSPIAVLRDCYPRHAWYEWRFARVPFGFWDDLENCRRYVRWLGKKLKISSLRDWHRVRRRDIVENCGAGLLAQYDSYWDLLTNCLPRLKRAVGKRGVKR